MGETTISFIQSQILPVNNELKIENPYTVFYDLSETRACTYWCKAPYAGYAVMGLCKLSGKVCLQAPIYHDKTLAKTNVNECKED